MTSNGAPKKLTSKFAYAAIGWLCALFISLKYGSFYALILTAAATAVSAAFLLLGTKHSRFTMLISAAGLAGALYFSAYNANVVQKQQALAGQELTVIGTVLECDRTGNDTLRITVKGRSEKAGGIRIIAHCRDNGIYCGDEVKLHFTAVLPENTAVFDGEDYYNSRGIFLQSSGAAEAEPTGRVNRPIRAVKRLRDKTAAAILASCPGQAGAFIVSVLCADRSHLEAATTDQIYRSGLGHIFAVSGTHVVILCAFISGLIEAVISSKRLRSGIMLLILAGFAVFAGCSVSVVRACLMCGIGFSAAFFDRRDSSGNSLGAAALLITLGCPYAVTSASFLLSFSASFSFGVLSPALCRGRVSSPTARTLVSYICVFIISFPFATYFFSELSLIMVFSNLLLLPLCSVCLCCAFAFMMSGCLLSPLICLSELSAAVVIRICAAVTRSARAYAGTYHKDTLILLGVVSIAVTLFAAFRKNRKRADILLCIVCFIAVCATSSMLTALVPRDMLIIYPDGANYTALIYADGRAMIFDIGDSGRLRYRAVRDAEALHADDTRLFLTSRAYSTMLSYSEQLSDIGPVYSSVGLGSIEKMPDELFIGGVCISPMEGSDGYKAAVGVHGIALGRESIVIDGETYLPERFEDISVFRLK